jgi:2-polyprenyl-3-methyl-5-hydroxy-6-metoxy-1,4-benzoquinol methylase
MNSNLNDSSQNFVFKWHLERPHEETLRNFDGASDVEFSGWVLTNCNSPVRLVTRQNGINSFYDLNNNRPDVVRKVLKSSEENHPALRCGFRHTICFSGYLELGFERKDRNLIQWVASFDLREYQKAIKQLQINPEINIFEDRSQELAQYWNIPKDEVKNIYEQFNVTMSNKLPRFVTDTLETIIDSYLDKPRILANISRMMLKYHRYSNGIKLVNCANSLIKPEKRSKTKVLDYGCGVADYALAFAKNGYSAAICDLSGGKIEFAEFRFKIRNIEVTSYPVTYEVEYPQIESIDIVVTAELLEHMRSPLQCLKNMYNFLNDDGYLWFSDFPMKPKRVRVDHLQSAADERLQCIDFIQSHFTLVDNPFIENFYQKKQ